MFSGPAELEQTALLLTVLGFLVAAARSSAVRSIGWEFHRAPLPGCWECSGAARRGSGRRFRELRTRGSRGYCVPGC
jgi:hypothetical protein